MDTNVKSKQIFRMSITEFSKQIQEQSDAYNEVLSACSLLLNNHPSASQAKKYLDSRCSEFYQKKFNFGYFPANEHLNDLFSILDRSVLESLGLIYNKTVQDSNVLRDMPFGLLNTNNLIMPFKNLYGDTLALVGRTLLENSDSGDRHIQKYKYTKNFNKRFHLFGLNFAKHSILSNNYVILVEGQFDCISAQSNGFHNVVAIGGASLSKHQFNILNRLTDNFYFLLDNDQAGEKGYISAQKRYGAEVNIKKIELPKEYKDVDEYLKQSINYNIFENL